MIAHTSGRHVSTSVSLYGHHDEGVHVRGRHATVRNRSAGKLLSRFCQYNVFAIELRRHIDGHDNIITFRDRNAIFRLNGANRFDPYYVNGTGRLIKK